MSEEEFPINETGFPYNPRFSTSTTPVPSMRLQVNRKPSIPVVAYDRLYIPGEGKMCPHKYFPEKLKQMKKQAAQQQQAAQQAPPEQQQQPQQQEGEDEEWSHWFVFVRAIYSHTNGQMCEDRSRFRSRPR